MKKFKKALRTIYSGVCRIITGTFSACLALFCIIVGALGLFCIIVGGTVLLCCALLFIEFTDYLI